MNTIENLDITDAGPNYIYEVTATFDTSNVPVSPKPVLYATAKRIKMTLSSTYKDEDKAAPNVDVIVQINPPPATVTLFDVNGESQDPNGEGLYPFTTDNTGNVTVYFAGFADAYHKIEPYSVRNASSEPISYTIYVGDYTQATTAIPAPSVPLNANNILEIPTISPFFYMNLIAADVLTDPQGYTCIAIINSVNFYVEDYTQVLESIGMKIPSAYLTTDKDNEIAYFLQNDMGSSVLTSPTLSFKAVGTPYIHPIVNPDQPRNLTARPGMNQGQTSITPSNSSYITMHLKNNSEGGGTTTYNAGDVVIFTMYINGYYARSNTKKATVFDLPAITIPAICPASISMQVPSNF
ncbi:hypothetical protein [Brucella rhizosphaerae]